MKPSLKARAKRWIESLRDTLTLSAAALALVGCASTPCECPPERTGQYGSGYRFAFPKTERAEKPADDRPSGCGYGGYRLLDPSHPERTTP